MPGKEVAEHHQSGIVIAPTLDYMDKAYIEAKSHGWSSAPIVEMLIPSTMDKTLAPEGKHVASLFCQQFSPNLPDGSSWHDHRLAAADTIIETVDSEAEVDYWFGNFHIDMDGMDAGMALWDETGGTAKEALENTGTCANPEIFRGQVFYDPANPDFS